MRNLGRVFVVALAVLIPVGQTAAQVELSEGCNLVNAFVPTGPFSSWEPSAQFYAGERVTVTADFPVTVSTPTQTVISVNFTQVATGPFPGSASYTFPADVFADPIALGVDGGNATITVSCEVGAPVPTTNLWMLAILLGLLLSVGLMASRRRIGSPTAS